MYYMKLKFFINSKNYFYNNLHLASRLKLKSKTPIGKNYFKSTELNNLEIKDKIKIYM